MDCGALRPVSVVPRSCVTPRAHPAAADSSEASRTSDSEYNTRVTRWKLVFGELFAKSEALGCAWSEQLGGKSQQLLGTHTARCQARFTC